MEKKREKIETERGHISVKVIKFLDGKMKSAQLLLRFVSKKQPHQFSSLHI